ncbi:hypothetical protein HAX54_015211 [Datura stramonium]|uniref:Uncharacterized protein n=1 Tax=Datura stramonium TaxID=4076 RepID=A0ABS8TSM8_DATST|nr:hypothetical protein [Datura stramonium]
MGLLRSDLSGRMICPRAPLTTWTAYPTPFSYSSSTRSEMSRLWVVALWFLEAPYLRPFSPRLLWSPQTLPVYRNSLSISTRRASSSSSAVLDGDDFDKNSVTHHSPTQVLKNFNEIKLLRIELPSGELGIDEFPNCSFRKALPAAAHNCGAQIAMDSLVLTDADGQGPVSSPRRGSWLRWGGWQPFQGALCGTAARMLVKRRTYYKGGNERVLTENALLDYPMMECAGNAQTPRKLDQLILEKRGKGLRARFYYGLAVPPELSDSIVKFAAGSRVNSSSLQDINNGKIFQCDDIKISYFTETCFLDYFAIKVYIFIDH